MSGLNFDIKKSFGSFRLDVQAQIPDGLNGIFGLSGSGKSTLLHCLTGYYKPDVGEISINGQTCFSSAQRCNISAQKRRVGMVFQDDLLFPHMTVKQNIFYGNKRGTSKSFIKEVVGLLSLYKLIDRMPETLSGGERQRVAIARTLLRQPGLILMDEPVSSLDLKTRYTILAYIKRIHENLKTPIIYVSHSISEMLYLTENTLLLSEGKGAGFGPSTATLMPFRSAITQEDEQIENIFDLPLLELREGVAVLKLGEQKIMAACSTSSIRPRLRVGIRSNDIIVSREPVGKISARNVLPAVLKGIYPANGKTLLETFLEGNTCFVEITPAACRDLSLNPGDAVYLIFKSRSMIVLEEEEVI